MPLSGTTNIHSLGFSRDFFLQVSSRTSAKYMSLCTWTVVVIASTPLSGIRMRRYTRGAVDLAMLNEAFGGVPVEEAEYTEAAPPPPVGRIWAEGGGAREATLDGEDEERFIFSIIREGRRWICESAAWFCRAAMCTVIS